MYFDLLWLDYSRKSDNNPIYIWIYYQFCCYCLFHEQSHFFLTTLMSPATKPKMLTTNLNTHKRNGKLSFKRYIGERLLFQFYMLLATQNKDRVIFNEVEDRRKVMMWSPIFLRASCGKISQRKQTRRTKTKLINML